MSIADTYRRIGLNPSVAQLALAKSIVGEPLDPAEREVYELSTGRADYSEVPYQEVTGIVGRKGGKTEYIEAPIVIYRAITDPPDSGIYQVCAPSLSDQARIGWEALNRQLQCGFPGMIADVKESDGRILLHNGNIIKVASANFRHLRGPKYVVVCIDEAAFFTSDDPELGFANPLSFILDSVAGGMVATDDPLLLLLTTPWIEDGIAWDHFRDRDANSDRLVWRAPTLLMNPHANQALMERHRKDRGENFYRREYLAEFSKDSFSYIDGADIDAAVSDAPSFPARPGVRYSMGLDPGRKRDHFGAAVAHREADTVIVDWCAEWKPGLFGGLKYADVLPQLWAKAREYHVRKIASDQVDFGGIEASIPRASGAPEFELEHVQTGGQSGAELADATRALFAQRKIVLPNQSGLADEFKRLADFLGQGGARDVRAKRGHDDRSRAVMLAVYQAYRQPRSHGLVGPRVLSIPRGAPSPARWKDSMPSDASANGPERMWRNQN